MTRIALYCSLFLFSSLALSSLFLGSLLVILCVLTKVEEAPSTWELRED